MSIGHRVLKFVRQLHLYLGIFTAPMLLFFAITGGLQTFSLHETTRGSSYTPPAWLASMAQLHKKQTTVMPVRRPRSAEAGAPMASPGEANAVAPSPAIAVSDTRAPGGSSQPADNTGARPKKNLLPMKIFFALVSLGLLISTLTGIYMAWRFSRKPQLVGGLLLAGILVPIALTLF
ncbi:hypothetical protein [Rhodanobacter sp. C03]|uniref:hypothetical protein n=1 Tax=Rhodanobacter sp. C03 TaxID=1945858 RepID=UPI000986F688|nr:hypothetical protein [Rhodanobacter sp. C03]OOG60231.1 hypothetical protein B0E48_05640 [Rhodanobacter sp. C03]